MKRIVRLTESDLTRIVNRVLNESISKTTFDSLWNSYPKKSGKAGTGTEYTPDEFFKLIIPDKFKSMRESNPDSWANSCAAKMSAAFLGSGSPPGGTYKIENDVKVGNTTLKKGSSFEPSSVAFKQILQNKFGEPTIVVDNDKGVAPKEIIGKKGAYFYEVSGWSNAAGHTDLWDGKQSAGNSHWESPGTLYFWQVPTQTQVNAKNCGWGNDNEGYKLSKWKCYDDPEKPSPAKNARKCGWGNDVEGYRKSKFKCYKDPAKPSPAKNAKKCGYGDNVIAYRKGGWKCKK